MNQLADISTKGHFTRDEGNHFLCLFNISYFSSQSCSEAISQNRSETMAKGQQEGDYDEGVVAKANPVRNVVWRSRAGLSTVSSSTVSSSPENFGSKDQEMRFEANTVQPVVENSEKYRTKSDTMTNSQGRHLDARSKAGTGSLVAWDSNQIKHFQASTGQPVSKKLVTDIDLEAKEEGSILSATSISFKEKV